MSAITESLKTLGALAMMLVVICLGIAGLVKLTEGWHDQEPPEPSPVAQYYKCEAAKDAHDRDAINRDCR